MALPEGNMIVLQTFGVVFRWIGESRDERRFHPMGHQTVFIDLFVTVIVGYQVIDLLLVGEDADAVFFLCLWKIVTDAVVDKMNEILSHGKVGEREVGVQLNAFLSFVQRDAVHLHSSRTEQRLPVNLSE